MQHVAESLGIDMERKEMIKEFDENRVIRALDKLFKENEEVKSRLAILEKLYFDMKEIRDEKRNENIRYKEI